MRKTASFFRPVATATSAASSFSITGVAAPDGAHADGEQLAAGVEVPGRGEILEGTGLDDVPGPHVRQERLEARLAGGGHGGLHEHEGLPGLLEAAELQRLVEQPGEAVVVAHADGQRLAPDPRLGRAERRLVGGRRFVPHPELEKDVSGHVQGMAGLGRDLRVRARRGQRFRGVSGIVVVVDQVVERAGMIGMAGQHPLEDRRGLLLDGAAHERVSVRVVAGVAEQRRAARGGGHEREGQEALHVGIVRVRRGQPPHPLRIRLIARRAVSASEQGLHRAEVTLLQLRLRLRGARRGRRRQPAQGCARFVRVLVEPERLVPGDGLAPVAQDEIAVHALRLAEGLDGVFVLEVVQRDDAAQERRPCGHGTGVGKASGGQDQEHDEREPAHRAMLACGLE
jgi:hypothetical protein